MRTQKSVETELARLRQRHTQQTEGGKWIEAQTTRSKIITLLDSITKFFPKWREQ